uniref:ATP synthase F0 subunit 8 n=1 Tax=Arcoscalpellum epeeum TaxID=2498141 RepID=A0A3S9LPG7_9CRUS|nr:ATP synthase F0 subunit 8 [Arcoscalpellum epeeum]
MPHMAPILWTLIFFFSFMSLITLSALLYFGMSPFVPKSSGDSLPLLAKNWMW